MGAWGDIYYIAWFCGFEREAQSFSWAHCGLCFGASCLLIVATGDEAEANKSDKACRVMASSIGLHRVARRLMSSASANEVRNVWNWHARELLLCINVII